MRLVMWVGFWLVWSVLGIFVAVSWDRPGGGFERGFGRSGRVCWGEGVTFLSRGRAALVGCGWERVDVASLRS